MTMPTYASPVASTAALLAATAMSSKCQARCRLQLRQEALGPLSIVSSAEGALLGALSHDALPRYTLCVHNEDASTPDDCRRGRPHTCTTCFRSGVNWFRFKDHGWVGTTKQSAMRGLARCGSVVFAGYACRVVEGESLGVEKRIMNDRGRGGARIVRSLWASVSMPNACCRSSRSRPLLRAWKSMFPAAAPPRLRSVNVVDIAISMLSAPRRWLLRRSDVNVVEEVAESKGLVDTAEERR